MDGLIAKSELKRLGFTPDDDGIYSLDYDDINEIIAWHRKPHSRKELWEKLGKY